MARLVLCAGLWLPAAGTWAQGPVSSFGNPGDEVAVTELGGKQAPVGQEAALRSGQAVAQAGGEGPLSVSVLDLTAKLAGLVLAVYAVAFGIKYGRQKGWRIQTSGAPAAGARLVQCGELALRGGATLHVVEVDQRPILLATHGTGDISLLLDLAPAAAEPEQAPAAPARRPDYFTPDAFAASATGGRLSDAAWEERRDTLIRALTQSTDTYV